MLSKNEDIFGQLVVVFFLEPKWNSKFLSQKHGDSKKRKDFILKPFIDDGRLELRFPESFWEKDLFFDCAFLLLIKWGCVAESKLDRGVPFMAKICSWSLFSSTRRSFFHWKVFSTANAQCNIFLFNLSDSISQYLLLTNLYTLQIPSFRKSLVRPSKSWPNLPTLARRQQRAQPWITSLFSKFMSF